MYFTCSVCVPVSATTPLALRLLPLAPDVGMTADVRAYGALNGSGNALKLKPKLSSMVSAFVIWPLV